MHRVVNQNSGLCLSVDWALPTVGANVKQHSCNNAMGQRLFFVVPRNDGYELQAVHSGLCVAVESSNGNNFGDNVMQAQCGSGGRKIWIPR